MYHKRKHSNNEYDEYDEYSKIWTSNNSKFLSNDKKIRLNNPKAETIDWGRMPPELKNEFELLKIDINLTGNPKKQEFLHTKIDNIHYTAIPNPHITVEFVDGSSFNYFINDNEDKRTIRVYNHRKVPDPLANRIINTKDFLIDKTKLLNLISKIINSNEFRQFMGFYYESRGINKKKRTRTKPKPKKQRTRTKPKPKKQSRNKRSLYKPKK
tara:strand:+ start:148 stop:783 length:636 start_codon:yes stop_codon:yes gene_type:complete